MEECKASVRAKVEHLFFYVKQMFGYSKTRYRACRRTRIGCPCFLDSPIYCVGNPVWHDAHRIGVLIRGESAKSDHATRLMAPVSQL